MAMTLLETKNYLQSTEKALSDEKIKRNIGRKIYWELPKEYRKKQIEKGRERYKRDYAMNLKTKTLVLLMIDYLGEEEIEKNGNKKD